MKGFFRSSTVLLLLALTGCSTTRFKLTSEPSGASVSVRETPLLYPLWSDPQWVQKGITPCTVVTTKTSWRPAYPPLAFRVALSTNQTRTIELKRATRPILGVGPYLILCGLPSGALAAAEGGSIVLGVVFGVGMTVAGFEMCDLIHYYPRTDIHVDFNVVDPNPNPAELPAGVQRFIPQLNAR